MSIGKDNRKDLDEIETRLENIRERSAEYLEITSALSEMNDSLERLEEALDCPEDEP